jgi:hypothetical protein
LLFSKSNSQLNSKKFINARYDASHNKVKLLTKKDFYKDPIERTNLITEKMREIKYETEKVRDNIRKE